LQQRDRALDPPAERRLDADVPDPDPGAHERAFLDPHQLAELAHLAEIVVPARQVEEQLADGEEAQATAGALEDVGGAEPRLSEHRVEGYRRIRRLRGARGR